MPELDKEHIKFVVEKWNDINKLREFTDKFIEWYDGWIENEIKKVFSSYNARFIIDQYTEGNDKYLFVYMKSWDLTKNDKWGKVAICIGGYSYSYSETKPYIGVFSRHKKREALLKDIQLRINDKFDDEGSKGFYKQIDISKEFINQNLINSTKGNIIEEYKKSIARFLDLGCEKIIDTAIKKIVG